MDHPGRNHRALPSAYYLGIQLGAVCTCDLEFLHVAAIRWPELEVLLTPLEGTK